MVDEFLALYEDHVLNPLVELDKDIRGAHATASGGTATATAADKGVGVGDSGRSAVEAMEIEVADAQDGSSSSSSKSCDDPLEMVKQMGSDEYVRWSPAARTRALAWLCDEALSAATMNDLVRKVLEAREVVDRRDREVRGEG